MPHPLLLFPASLSLSVQHSSMVGTSDPKACLRCSDLHLSFGSSLDCVFPVVGCFRGDLQLSWAVALCQLRHPLMLFPWDFCAHSSIRVRVEVMGMQELLLTGSVLSGRPMWGRTVVLEVGNRSSWGKGTGGCCEQGLCLLWSHTGRAQCGLSSLQTGAVAPECLAWGDRSMPWHITVTWSCNK